MWHFIEDIFYLDLELLLSLSTHFSKYYPQLITSKQMAPKKVTQQNVEPVASRTRLRTTGTSTPMDDDRAQGKGDEEYDEDSMPEPDTQRSIANPTTEDTDEEAHGRQQSRESSGE